MTKKTPPKVILGAFLYWRHSDRFPKLFRLALKSYRRIFNNVTPLNGMNKQIAINC